MDDTKMRLYHNRFPFDKNRKGLVKVSSFLTVCNFVPLHIAVFRKEVLQYAFELLLESPFNQVCEQYILKLIEDKYGSGCYSGTWGGVWRRHGQQITALQMQSGVAEIEEPIERHWYATMAPNPDKVSVFMALLNFVRLCSRVNYFSAAKWLVTGEGRNYAMSLKLSLDQDQKRFQGVALAVAAKYTTYSMINLCSSDELKDWLQITGYATTKNGLKLALEEVRQVEGDAFINREEIYTVCNKFFPLDDRTKAYNEWRNQRVLTDADQEIFLERAKISSVQPNILLVTLLESNNTERLSALIDSLSQQIYSGWNWVVISKFPCPDPLFNELDMLHWVDAEADVYATLQTVMANLDGFDWVTVLPEGASLAPQACMLIANYISLHPEWVFIYSDEDVLDSNGNHVEPLFKPDFNLDFMRSTNYIGELCVVKKSVLDELGGFCSLTGVLNWDMALKVYDALGSKVIGHIPDILLHQSSRILTDIEQRYLYIAGKHILEQHLARNAISASVSEGLVSGTFYIDYPLTESPSVAVIVTVTCDAQLENLSDCLESLISRISYPNIKVVILSALDNVKIEAVLADFDKNGVEVIEFEYNPGGIFQSIEWLAQIKTDFCWFFNVDLKVVQDQSLERMLAHGLRANVGIVSARIVTHHKTVHHAGMILGMGDLGVAGYPHKDLPISDPGYMNRAGVVQNFSAISEQCFLVKTNLLKEVIETGEIETSIFGCVEFCLAVTKRQLLIVWTPFVTFLLNNPILQECEMADLRSQANSLLSKHLSSLAFDAAYSRHLSLKHRHYQIELETGVSWNTDFNDKPRVFAFPANDSGVGEYRIRSPLRGLTRAGLIQSSLLPNHSQTLIPDIVEIERAKPNVLILQNGTADYLLHAWEQYRKFNEVFMIYSQDDLVYALPGKHPYQGIWPKDMRRRLRKQMELSDRLIVATEPLKEAFESWIDDIRVVPNFLETNKWLKIIPVRKVREKSHKPRVGWAGGGQHHGDLEFILPVIEATKNEVDWVFMGMCPENVRPLIKEYWGGVGINDYPAHLAKLDLDLAIAPLEYNNFNMAKTNLRLLEYGVLGWPVVCSDITPYRNAPVTRVSNNVNHWIKAIREKINEPDELVKEGQVLKQWVLDNYLLEDHLDQWLEAITPN
jgi:hypothetical protein